MNTLLERAFHKAESLPDDKQGELANALLTVIEEMELPDEIGDLEWDTMVSSPKSLSLLEEMGAKALEAREQGKTTPLNFKNRPRAL